MTTPQLIALAILVILFIIGYFGRLTSKEDKSRILFGVLWMFVTVICILLVMVITMELNNARKLLDNKCPEYEKVENVYRLKETQ